MSLKTYTITVDGDDNGNVIAAPFTIDVHQVLSIDEGETSLTQVRVCTKNATMMCGNSDIPDLNNYELVADTLTRIAVLAATIEVDLEAAYPGAWS